MRLLFACVILCLTAGYASAQINYQPTPAPVATAESEEWYLAGEPVMYAGNIYYPAGPKVHFNGNEMVRSGFFQGIPLYTRTTIEPYSKVFVPLATGLMQPYERRRTGDMAGTVGSTAPSFPVVRSSELDAEADSFPQAPAPPGLLAVPPAGSIPPVSPVADARPAPEQPRTVGTTGLAAPRRAAPAPPRVPTGNHGLFIEFDGRRWFAEGHPAPLDASRMIRIGEHHDFPVYADPAGDPGAIYVPVSSEAAAFVARYSRRRPR